MATRVSIKGLGETDAALKELSVRTARRVVQGALAAGGRVLRDEARRRVPRGKDAPDPKYGRLHRQIRVIILRRARGWMARVDTGQAFWARWLEFGRAAFTVKKKRVLSDGNKFYGRKVKATPARPFMRPALDARKEEIVRAIGQRLGQGVMREAARLRRNPR